jgi:hypothetical protein
MILLDYNQTAISTLMAQGANSPNADISLPLVRHMIMNTIRGLNVKYRSKYGKMVICCDNRNYWRKERFPHYKANRKVNRKKSNLDWDAIFKVLNTVRDELNEYFPYPVLDIPRAEADDVIGSLVFHSQTLVREGGIFDDVVEPVLILSGDHDFQQLQKFSNVTQYDPVKKAEITLSAHPSKVLLEHIIRGDVGDGIPNFLSPDDVFVTPGTRQKSIMQAKLDVWLTQKPSEFLLDEEDRKRFERNRELIDLSYIPQEIQEDVVAAYTSQLETRNKSKLKMFFAKNDMMVLFDHLSDF